MTFVALYGLSTHDICSEVSIPLADNDAPRSVSPTLFIYLTLPAFAPTPSLLCTPVWSRVVC